jgi:hypothetical protein
MQTILMLFAATGIFYISLSQSLHDMTVNDCNSGIENACTYLESKQ